MPASAVKPVASLGENPLDQDAVADDTQTRLARSAQRLAQLSRSQPFGVPYGAPTLDLFADDTERATLQAMNTDVRQGTLAGFELPDVFMAAVSATADADDPLASVRLSRPASVVSAGAAADSAQDVASLDLFIDETDARTVIAGPTRPDDAAEPLLRSTRPMPETWLRKSESKVSPRPGHRAPIYTAQSLATSLREEERSSPDTGALDLAQMIALNRLADENIAQQ